MLEVGISRVRPEQAERLRQWFAMLQGSRRAEVERSFNREGVQHEKVVLVETSDGPLMIYAMEMDDVAKAQSIFAASTEPIDVEHRAVLKSVLDGIPEQQLLFDVSVRNDISGEESIGA